MQKGSVQRPAILVTACLAAVVACHAAPSQTGDDAHTGASGDLDESSLAPSNDGPFAARDARADLVAAARAALDAGTFTGLRIGAMSMQTSVLSTTSWPESDGGLPSTRLGYLRHGANVPVVADPIVNEACPEGWFELVVGGFVCGKYATLDLKHPRVRLAPSPPNTAQPLPYRYGYNLANGTPLYRRVLSVTDRKKYEPWLEPKPARVEDAGEEPSPATAAAAGEESDGLDAGAIFAPVVPVASAAPSASAPWFLRMYDGGRPQVTLDELHGRGVLVRRMVRGFYLALDRDFRAAHARWWRTTAGFAVPFDRVVVQQPLPDFHGMWLSAASDVPSAAADAGPADGALVEGGFADGEVEGAKFDDGAVPDSEAPLRPPDTLPRAIAFVTSSSARKYTIDTEKKKIGWGLPVVRRTAVELTGAAFVLGGATYNETTEGGWILRSDLIMAKPSKTPEDLLPKEKWIDVDLTRQILVAFEGEKPVFTTLVASGKRNLSDKTKDRPTPVGTFRIREKHISSTMDGDVAADGPYSIEDVPWVMYFQGSYALHGAFWHNQFGRTMSHGCVNLSPSDARTIFRWTEPHLPEGWHGVFAEAGHLGTRVIVHEDAAK